MSKDLCGGPVGELLSQGKKWREGKMVGDGAGEESLMLGLAGLGEEHRS